MTSSSEQTPPILSMPFSALVKPHWFNDPSNSAVLFWIVTTIWMDYNGSEASKRFSFEISLEHPVKVTLGEITSVVSVPFLDVVVTSNSSGEPKCNVEVTSTHIPAGVYLMLSTPIQADGVDLGEEGARARLEASAALLAINTGRNLVREILFEGVHSGSTGLQTWSRALQAPDRIHGPHLDEPPWHQVSQTLAALRSTEVALETRDKVRRALHFLARAIKTDEPFIFYWIALEILCGKSLAIKDKLSKIYGLKKQQHIDQCTGLSRIAALRHALVHGGKHSALTPTMERHLQLLLLDIINFELKIPGGRQAIKFQEEIGDAIFEIGVPKNWRQYFPSADNSSTGN